MSEKRPENFHTVRSELLSRTIYPQIPRVLIEGIAIDIDVSPKYIAKVMLGMVRRGNIAVRYHPELFYSGSVQASGEQTRQLFLPGFDPAAELMSFKQIVNPNNIEETIVSSHISPLSYEHWNPTSSEA